MLGALDFGLRSDKYRSLPRRVRAKTVDRHSAPWLKESKTQGKAYGMLKSFSGQADRCMYNEPTLDQSYQ